jgi:CMP/dCMP kinase
MPSKPAPKKRVQARKRPRRRALVIAIDGPAGSGKSTVSAGVAKALGLRRLDTGAMYRALTLKSLRAGTSSEDARGLAALARTSRFTYRDSTISLDGRPVGDAIRRPEVSRVVSAVAAHRSVRRELVRRQREIIGKGGVVVEGRDIGTVVCPDADLKVFLTASPAERARRRHRELTDAGVRVSLATLEKDQKRRDSLDSTREESPLRPAPDAVIVDSTGKTPREVIAEIVGLARDLGLHEPPKRKATGAKRAST